MGIMKMTHRCGHKVKYDYHGSYQYALELLEKVKHQPCPDCVKKGIRAENLAPVER